MGGIKTEVNLTSLFAKRLRVQGMCRNPYLCMIICFDFHCYHSMVYFGF